jgi:hypothetical protein
MPLLSLQIEFLLQQNQPSLTIVRRFRTILERRLKILNIVQSSHVNSLIQMLIGFLRRTRLRADGILAKHSNTVSYR